MSHERRDDDDQIHVDLYSQIAECKQRIHVDIHSQIAECKQRIHELQHRVHELEHAEHASNTVVNIEHITVIGGDMAKLNLTALQAAVAENKSVGEVFDSLFDAIAEAIKGAGSNQAELDALVVSLTDDNVREKLRANALKGLITPALPALAAVYNGPTAATVGTAFSGSVAASGGTAPYSFTQDSGALPDGVTFVADGSVSGAPGTAGEFSFGGSVSDAAGATAQWTGSVSVS